MNKATFYVNGERVEVSPSNPTTTELKTVPGWVWVVYVLLLAIVAGSLDSWASPSNQQKQINSQEPN
ncbi:MAG TPA: hypothetical protein VK171_05455 [Fimbriimonas sp.]|nr:hypothetical protein [Fimbriimonas sp.]